MFRKITIICPKHGVFKQNPDHHIRGSGCSKCTRPKIISKPETAFLDYLGIPLSHRQVYIPPRFHADGYDPNQNTVIEFLGDYYHGNPDKFASDKYNKVMHKTYGQLYDRTMARFAKLKAQGFRILYAWENDWVLFQKALKTNKHAQLNLQEYIGNTKTPSSA